MFPFQGKGESAEAEFWEKEQNMPDWLQWGQQQGTWGGGVRVRATGSTGRKFNTANVSTMLR
jgi:hypothetical protein